jgi:hypothetical protein
MVNAHVRALANALDVILQTTVSMRNIVLKGSAEMKHVLASLAIGACLLLPSAGAVFAQTTGQPGTNAGVNCGPIASSLATPGNAGSSPGAPFNEPGAHANSPGKAGTVYAGSGANLNGHSNQPIATSQYDVACLKVTTQVP